MNLFAHVLNEGWGPLDVSFCSPFLPFAFPSSPSYFAALLHAFLLTRRPVLQMACGMEEALFQRPTWSYMLKD